MMRSHGFGRGILFAAAAALLWPPWALVAAPLLGAGSAAALYLAAVAAAYTAAIAPPSWPRLRVAALSALAALAVAAAAQRGGEIALGLAAIVGVARSGFFYRRAPARALLTEIALLGGGLLFARSIGGPGLLSGALALWGFLLVQSVFFLIGGLRSRRPNTPAGDPFDDAYRRAMALLEG